MSSDKAARARVGTHLNFRRGTEKVFGFCRSVFGGEFNGQGRFGGTPPSGGQPPLAEADGDPTTHLGRPILDGHRADAGRVFWGAYFGSFTNRFGVRWRVSPGDKFPPPGRQAPLDRRL